MINLPLSILDSNELYTASKRIHAVLNSDLSGDNYVASLCGKLAKGTTDVEKPWERPFQASLHLF
jgi:hypothetical protein